MCYNYYKKKQKVDIMSKFIIEDWAGNVMFHGKEFDTFEDGWDYIYENIKEEFEGDGTYDDVFVIEKK